MFLHSYSERLGAFQTLFQFQDAAHTLVDALFGVPSSIGPVITHDHFLFDYIHLAIVDVEAFLAWLAGELASAEVVPVVVGVSRRGGSCLLNG